MPNCTGGTEPFSKLRRREIDVRFDGGDVSSDGGLLLLREVERRLGLLKAIAPVLPDPRNPALVRHTTEHLLRQRVFALCQGYEDLNDHDRLRDDLALQTALERDTPAASSATLCRFENRADRAAAVATQRILIEQFIDSFKQPPTELILDFDTTDDLVHGNQEGRHFSGYYDGYLTNVLERISDHPINRIDELLPWSVASSLPSTAHVEPIRSLRAPVVNDLRYGALVECLPKIKGTPIFQILFPALSLTRAPIARRYDFPNLRGHLYRCLATRRRGIR